MKIVLWEFSHYNTFEYINACNKLCIYNSCILLKITFSAFIEVLLVITHLWNNNTFCVAMLAKIIKYKIQINNN